MIKSNEQSLVPVTLSDHLKELRMRLLASIVVLAISGTIVYFFYGQILALLGAPLGAPLYYDSPAGSFSFIMKICFMGALIISIPVIIYNLIMFTQPAFASALTKKRIYLTTLFSTFFAISGAAFAYCIILPGSLKFFASFQVSGLHALISADNYLGFVTNIIITFIIVFQLPLLIVFFDSVKPIPPTKLLKNEKWVILGSLVIALIVPFTYDLVTSLFIALPIIVLYNISIIAVVINHAKAARKEIFAIKLARTNLQPVIRPELTVDENAIYDFSDELKNLEKNNASVVSNNSIKASAGSEIRPSTYKQESVEPAAWVQERKLRRLAISAQVNVFSDISNN